MAVALELLIHQDQALVDYITAFNQKLEAKYRASK